MAKDGETNGPDELCATVGEDVGDRVRSRSVKERRRDSAKTRADILHVAVQRFARVGYAHVTLKEIADDVGVTPAMIVRYFGSKLGLFKAVVGDNAGSCPVVPTDKPHGDLAELVARDTVSYWDDENSRWTAMAVVRSLEVPETAALFREEIQSRIIGPGNSVIAGGEDAEIRLRLLAGVIMGAGLIGLGALLEPDRPKLSHDEFECVVRCLTAMIAPAIGGEM
ncbi:TetR/AcrR family transcriptional regulator [Streptomyces sp. Y7]|uniref:TetR/AcrR family transcriptional regulator n=1 Tax=Streptomyces sp. Y7 TaxID=3342392 RepID=UPI0037182901